MDSNKKNNNKQTFQTLKLTEICHEGMQKRQM